MLTVAGTWNVYPLTWLVANGFCCIGISWREETTGPEERTADDNWAGARVEQSSFQGTDGVKKDSRQTACETQRAQLSQFWIQL